MTYLEILKKVTKLNAELVSIGYDYEMIKIFWTQVFEDLGKQLKK